MTRILGTAARAISLPVTAPLLWASWKHHKAEHARQQWWCDLVAIALELPRKHVPMRSIRRYAVDWVLGRDDWMFWL